MSGYPKTLHHPAAQKSVIKSVTNTDAAGRPVTDHFGTADKFPPVTVFNADQEAQHRAMGYVHDEDPELRQSYRDYPVWMKNEAGDERLAEDEKGETRLKADGYARKGQGDPDAVRKAYSAPYDPAFEASEWPKMIDGVLVDDPAKANDQSRFYPMWVGEKLVHSEAEEREARGGKIFRDGKLVDPAPEVEKAPADPVRDALLLIAEAKGLVVDPSWTREDLEAALFANKVAAQLSTAGGPNAVDPSKASEADERAKLIAEAEAKGIKVDKRWNLAKLQAALGESEAA